MKKNIIISAGGTGGHIFPALAVAKELTCNYNIIWVGAKTGLENQLIPKHGYVLETVSVAGVRNKGFLRKLSLPWVLFKALWQCIYILLKYNPCATIGFGGYATFPICLGSRLFAKPVLIHEQNSVAGLTNRVIAKIATRILTAFPGVLPSPKTVLVGNPVRKEILELGSQEQRVRETDKLRILIIGGSLGAKVLNDTVPLAVAKIGGHIAEVIHQVGRGDLETVQSLYAQYGIKAFVTNFIDDMARAYLSSDVIICRAGASTVAEVAAAGVAAIFVPYPYAVDDHQTTNARYLSEHGAALLIPQPELTADGLARVLAELTPGKCHRMATQARQLAILDATHRICNQLANVV